MLDTVLICSVISMSVDLVGSLNLSRNWPQIPSEASCNLSDTDLCYTGILAFVPLCLNACGDYFTGSITCTICYPYTMSTWKRG
jgi:hypothetical protein